MKYLMVFMLLVLSACSEKPKKGDCMMMNTEPTRIQVRILVVLSDKVFVVETIDGTRGEAWLTNSSFESVRISCEDFNERYKKVK